MEENINKRLDSISRALRRAAESFRDDNEEQLSNALFKISNKADQYFGTIRSKSPGELVSELEKFARSRPLVVFAGMALLGSVLSALYRSISKQSLDWPQGFREEERRVV